MGLTLTIRELIVKLGLSADTDAVDRFNKAIDATKNRLSVTGAAFERFGKAMTAAGRKLTTTVTLPIVGVGALMVKTAADAEESESKFDAVFKNQKDDVRAWSNALAKDIGRSSYQIREFAAGLQDTFVPLGFARDKAADFSKKLTELAIDVSSFQNKAEPEVIQAFTSAIVGNHEAVRQFGITITESRLKEKIAEMSKTVAGFKKESIDTQKVLARYQLITEGTSDAHGDAKRTAGSFTNQMKALKSQLIEVAVIFGKEIIPLLQPIIKGFGDFVKRLSGADQHTKDLIKKIVLFVAAIGPLLLILGTLSSSLLSIINLYRLLKTTSEIAGIAGKGMWRGILGPIGLIITAVTLIITYWDEIYAWILKFWELLKRAAAVFWESIKNIGNAIAGVFSRAWDYLAALPGRIWTAITSGVAAAIQWIKSQIQALIAWGLAQFSKLANVPGLGILSKILGQKAAAGVAAGERGVAGGALGAMSQFIPSLAPVAAAAGGGGINYQPTINVNVPPGTPASEAQRISDVVGNESSKTFRRTIGDVRR